MSITAISLSDLKCLAVIALFVSALVVARFPVPAKTFSIVRLVEAPGDRAVAILVLALPARFATLGFHAWWVYLNCKIAGRKVKGTCQTTTAN
jgi:hypothetical protein